MGKCLSDVYDKAKSFKRNVDKFNKETDNF